MIQFLLGMLTAVLIFIAIFTTNIVLDDLQ